MYGENKFKMYGNWFCCSYISSWLKKLEKISFVLEIFFQMPPFNFQLCIMDDWDLRFKHYVIGFSVLISSKILYLQSYLCLSRLRGT